MARLPNVSTMDIGVKRGKVGVWVDTSQLNDAIARSKIAGREITNKQVEMTAREFVQKVEQKTPVQTGRARSGWYKGVVGTGGSWTDKGSDPKMIRLGKSEGEFIDNTDRMYKRHITIKNHVPYINALEAGWSLQAPSGMVRLTVLEMQGKLTKRVIKGYTTAWYKKGMKITRGKTSGYNPKFPVV